MTVIDEIAAERARQIHQEGFTLDHDDRYDDLELAKAALSYTEHYLRRQWLLSHPGNPMGAVKAYQDAKEPSEWPWASERWKPKNPRRDLIRAAALIIAEIERMDRATPQTELASSIQEIREDIAKLD